MQEFLQSHAHHCLGTSQAADPPSWSGATEPSTSCPPQLRVKQPQLPGSLTFSPSYLQMSSQLPPKLLLSLEKDPEHQITISRFMPSANLLLLSHFIPQQASMEGVAALPHHCCQHILGACLKPQRLPLD